MSRSSARSTRPPPPPGAPGPFALSDEAALRAFAAGSGLEPVEVLDVESPWSCPDLDTAVRAIENWSEEAVSRAHAEAWRGSAKPTAVIGSDRTFRCLFARA